jgi:hypothetical protein
MNFIDKRGHEGRGDATLAWRSIYESTSFSAFGICDKHVLLEEGSRERNGPFG